MQSLISTNIADPISYLKCMTLFKRYHQKNGTPAFLSFAMIYRPPNYYIQGSRFIEPLYVTPHNRWESIEVIYPTAGLKQFDFYRLSGALEVDDYDVMVDNADPIEPIDEIVLASDRQQVLRVAGYWPEYNEAGNKQWRWVRPPNIELADEAYLIDQYLKEIIGLHTIQLLDGHHTIITEDEYTFQLG